MPIKFNWGGTQTTTKKNESVATKNVVTATHVKETVIKNKTIPPLNSNIEQMLSRIDALETKVNMITSINITGGKTVSQTISDLERITNLEHEYSLLATSLKDIRELINKKWYNKVKEFFISCYFKIKRKLAKEKSNG